MHARINIAEWNPQKMKEAVRLTEETIIPAYQKQQGFRGYLLLTEHGSERAIAITMWETEADMEASAAVARAMIPKLKDILRGPPETTTYEVLFSIQR